MYVGQRHVSSGVDTCKEIGWFVDASDGAPGNGLKVGIIKQAASRCGIDNNNKKLKIYGYEKGSLSQGGIDKMPQGAEAQPLLSTCAPRGKGATPKASKV